ncbi:serine/threonine-protein kinase [Blastococcus sp. Marseille-P5729]|uniref:serine/threonine-protein kinase n=1 Tax=Blastococcus sp. Marseille-P5729 TaxID=2086582 RepID=UPI00131C5E9F|nr:serine/threonine-protein kinase [Blastococcus sp. Marseille-P5729]
MQRAPDIPGLTDLVPIGQGGNGVVYRATQRQLSRVVAVKVLGARLDDVSADRFAREGQALGLVSGHPNIVPVYTADTTPEGRPYLVMLLCENGSLADRVESGGPMSPPAVLDLGIRMCGALQTAHDAGLLHRDIKPGNILFDSYDVPRLADFGQARFGDVNLTKTGDVVATPGYAAPEVLTGERATIRSDVYSLATTLMAALLGHGPFSRDSDENIAATLLRVVQDAPPDLRQLGVPHQLAAELERAMDKTAGRRHMSAAELGRRLQEVQASLGLPHTPMIIAGSPAPQSPLPPLTGALPLEDRVREGERTRVVGGASPPGSTAVIGRDNANKPARSPLRWVAVLAAVAVVAGLAIWGVTQLTDSRKPTNPTDAGELIVGSSDYGPGSWQATEDMGLLTEVIGEVPTGADDESSSYPSGMILCLGLEPETEVSSSKPSAQYVDTDATEVSEDGDSVSSYRYARSLAMVMGSASDAERYVTAFASPRFDTCLDELDDLGVSAGREQAMYGESAKISVPEHEPDMPDGTHFQARQIEIPLQRAGDSDSTEQGSNGEYKQQGSRYVTVLAMSAGTSVEYVVMQSSSDEVPDEMIDSVTEAFLAVATA